MWPIAAAKAVALDDQGIEAWYLCIRLPHVFLKPSVQILKPFIEVSFQVVKPFEDELHF